MMTGPTHPHEPQSQDTSLFQSRYPHFNVLDKWTTPDWDDQTRDAIRRRLEEVPTIRFFTESERRTLEAVVEQILPQPDRTPLQKVPIVPWIDKKLFDDTRDGYRRDVLPPQQISWRMAIKGIDETARALYNKAFSDLESDPQRLVLERLQQGEPPGETWKILPSHVFFSKVLTVAVVKIYYAHPMAWNEIGYHGPSSPRGYSRIWDGGIDPWDAQAEHGAHNDRS